jgi:hypothetical protein
MKGDKTMTRQDFIFTLFDNGQGLSLNQIERIEEYLPDIIPESMIEDMQEVNGMSEEDAIQTALYQARDIFMDNLKDCTDMLSLRDYLIERYQVDASDMQVYRLWYVTRGGID